MDFCIAVTWRSSFMTEIFALAVRFRSEVLVELIFLKSEDEWSNCK